MVHGACLELDGGGTTHPAGLPPIVKREGREDRRVLKPPVLAPSALAELASMAKVQAANTLHEAADMAIQINGARGYSKDTVLEWIYRYARQARLVDGADEVHQMVLNRFLDKEGDDFWRWQVAGA